MPEPLKIHLIHGPDPVEIQNERIRILDLLLPEDQRAENLTEYNPGQRGLTLKSILPDLLADLGTASFFPGVLRVAVVNDLNDFWEAEEKPEKKAVKRVRKGEKNEEAKRSPIERLIRYLETDYDPQTTALVFTVQEIEEKRRAVNLKNKLVQFIEKNGRRKGFTRTPVAFQFGDAIRARDLAAALGLFRQIYGQGRQEQKSAAFNPLLREVRYMLQAKIVAGATHSGQGLSRATISADFLPSEKKSNILEMHEYPRRKYMEGARRFNTATLIQAMSDLYEINKALFPTGGDGHVADARYLMERLLIRLCTETT